MKLSFYFLRMGTIATSILFSFLLLTNIHLHAQTKKQSGADTALFFDSHFHLTNYVQEGISIQKFLAVMGTTTGRSTLFGIPLQQQWSYANTGDFAPTYYLASDAPLYYYSFTDAYIAMTYRSLSANDQKRFDPMITGFNPTDMYATDHIKRVLLLFPGVFSGIGEFSIHKEFVSSKIAGEVASLTNPALDRIFDFCAESGLLSILHNDIDMPFPKSGQDPYLIKQIVDLFRRHKNAKIIWAHCGLGRIVRPVEEQISFLDKFLSDPTLSHVYFDISWSEVAKYIVATPATIKATATLINKYPDRFLFGTDEVAPPNAEKYQSVYRSYQPLFEQLSADAKYKLLKGNYTRLFDAARVSVRAWEKAHQNDSTLTVPVSTTVSGLGKED